ncbi:MAG: galactokinase family protein [Acidimicrobiales bacterium]|jgi:galactokinase
MGVEHHETRAYSPGRVNLIGDHTDYNEGLALPMAVDLGTTVAFTPDASRRVVLFSAEEPEPADVDLHVRFDVELLQAFEPRWARYVAAMVAMVRPRRGGRGTVDTTLPVGAGLSSSASLEVALALALGFEAEPVTIATTCQRAEQAATGVASGLMDQLVVSQATEGCALLVDFSDLSARHVHVPEQLEVVVVHCGERRTLDHSPYMARRAECEAAAFGLGPLGHVSPDDLVGISDALLRRRARHVVTECDRVRWCASALESGDLKEAGRLMTASHRSLAQDFEVSTRALDDLVEHLLCMPGVFGARLTGAGFGGCVVALTELGAVDLTALRTPAWRVRPSTGAHLLSGA